MLEQAEKLPVSDVLRFGLASAEFAEAVCVAGVKGDKLTIEIPHEISNSLFALGKLNGIMMQEIFDFGIEWTRERIYKISHITFSFFRIFPRFIFEHFKNIRNVIIHFAPCLCRAFHLFISSSFSSGVVKCALKFGAGRHKPSCSASSSARANFSAPSFVVMCTLVKMLDVAIVCLRFDLLRILYRIRIIFIGEIVTNEVELNRVYSANNARMGVENIILGGFLYGQQD